MPKLLSVNVSEVKETTYDGKPITTGIFKEPVGGRVHPGKLNLAGDDVRVAGYPSIGLRTSPAQAAIEVGVVVSGVRGSADFRCPVSMAR